MVAKNSSAAAMMGGPALRTRLRCMKELDIQAAQESPPPPTFTVPAFRARKHRGGESELLKDAYPSGFCTPLENRPLPITTTTTTTDRTTRKTLVLSGPRLRDVLHESKEVGVPPWGAAASRRALNITRVVVGAKDVVDTVGSELVQFGPGFSIGPAERSSPRTSVNRPHQARPRTPASPMSPSRMTIDGSSLRGWNSLLVGPSAVDRGNEWSQRKICGRRDWTSPRDEGKREGCKRIRPTTADTDQCSRGPEPWPYSAETLTGRSSRPSTAGQGPKPASRKRRGPGGVVAAPVLRVGVHDGVGAEQEDGRNFGGNEDPAVAEVVGLQTDDSLGRERSSHLDGRDNNHVDSVRNHPETSKLANQLCPLEAHGTLKSVGGQEEEGYERGERVRGQVALLNKDELTGSGRRGGALTLDAKDNSSVWSDGSACFFASVTTNDNSAVYASSVADGSVEQVSAKRSFSTLDTERYRGSLSKDATDILRSHLESRNKPPGNANSCLSHCRTAIPAEATALTSPAPPPTPPGQYVDSLLGAGGPGHSTPFYLPPMDRSPETCYVRTRGDIVLAVVRKKELLECDDDADLRTLKTTARPVRIKAGMTMTEGMHAIVASGILRHDGVKDECEILPGGRQTRSSRAGAEGDIRGTCGRGTCGRAQALEYFNSQAGAWHAIRSESDWKILLAAQPGPQGAGAVFQAAGANGRGADFLVAVTPAPIPLETRANRGEQAQASTRSIAPRKLKAVLARASKENRNGWRYASFVTPGVLSSPELSTGRYGRSSSPQNHHPGGEVGRNPTETWTKEARHERDGPAQSPTAAVVIPFPDERTGTHDREKERAEDKEDVLARLVGGKRSTGPGPGAALWIPTSTTTPAGTVGRGNTGACPHRPKKAKVRRLVRHLEAGLKLKGRPGAGGLPVGAHKIDMPYTKELAKWSYDEILGIPRTTVPARSP